MPCMLHIKHMTAEDIAFAVHITATMNWELIEKDFKFMLKLEPHGCFILLDDSEKVGIVTTISFDKIGWLGTLIVDEDHRKKGAGSLLVKQAVKYLTSKNVETIGLYSYSDNVPFYRKLGFKYDSEFIVLKGKSFSSPIMSNLREAKKEDVPEIIDFDKTCFGASRRKLLKPILSDPNNSCYMSIEGGQILGYAVAKPYGGTVELGPLVCRQGHSDLAIDLLKANIEKLEKFNAYICVPKKEFIIIDMLTKCGFSEYFRVARMFSKPRIVKECVYIAESLERG